MNKAHRQATRRDFLLQTGGAMLGGGLGAGFPMYIPRSVLGGANEPAKVVMADLARFCNATKPSVRVSPQTGAIDPMAMAVGEGRREVYLRIQTHLGLTDADVRAIARETDDG